MLACYAREYGKLNWPIFAFMCRHVAACSFSQRDGGILWLKRAQACCDRRCHDDVDKTG